jgi:uncharacterized membrane protein
VIAEPPSEAGSPHASATACDDGVAVGVRGTEGTVAGAAAKDAEYAKLFGEPTPVFVTTFFVAASVIAVATAAGVADVRVSKYTAAIPATNGDAIDVPDMLATAVVEPLYADEILEPGANMSRHVP